MKEGAHASREILRYEGRDDHEVLGTFCRKNDSS